MKLGFVDPIIGLDVTFSNNPINSEMVENTPIFNSDLQERSRLNYKQELNTKSQKRDKLIADKNSVMKVILHQCDEYIRAEIALGLSYEDNLEARELIKFLAREYARSVTILRMWMYFLVLR